MEFVKLVNCFRYLVTNTFFFTGQLSSFEICPISVSLSLCSLLHWYSRRSTVWFPLAQGHFGDSIILKRCRYDLVFPCTVAIAVKLGVRLIFVFSLSLMIGKKIFGCKSFSSVVPLLLPLFHAFLSFLVLYFTFWEFIVAYVTVSSFPLSEFVCKLVSLVSCGCLYPCVFYVPVFLLQCDGLSYFFYEMVMIFLVFEGVQGYPAVCVY